MIGFLYVHIVVIFLLILVVARFEEQNRIKELQLDVHCLYLLLAVCFAKTVVVIVAAVMWVAG